MPHHTLEPHLRLLPGQALGLHVDRHATLFVVEGTVTVVVPPIWLGERLLVERTRLQEGQALVASHGGWMQVAADGTAPVALVQFAHRGSAGPWPAAALRSFVAMVSQRMRALRGFS